MRIDRALEIVTAINERCFFTMGITETLAPLSGVSLAEMIEAKAEVEAFNRDEEARQKAEGGSRKIRVVPDDRLIAAAYCAEHYPVSNEAILSLPITGREGFWHETDRKALALIPLRTSDDGEGDE